MAKVTITLTDEPDDHLTIRVESDPPFPGPAAKDQTLTAAQSGALRALESINDGAEVVSKRKKGPKS